MAEEQQRPDDLISFDLGEPAKKPAAAPPPPAAADDPFAALASDLATTMEEDDALRRSRAADEQRRLAAERAGSIELAVPDAAQIAADLQTGTVSFGNEEGPRIVETRIERPAARRPGMVRRLAGHLLSLVATLLSTGPDRENTPRVAAGYAARGVASALVVALAVAGFSVLRPGLASDTPYYPDAALVRHTGGLATRAIADLGHDADGMLNCDATTGVALQATARGVLDLLDAAAASGDTTALAAAFSTPEAAAPWVADAVALHAKGARRTYDSRDPHAAPAICDAITGGDGLTLRFPGFYRYDLGPGDQVLVEQPYRSLVFTFTRKNGSWALDSAVFFGF